MLVTVGKVLQKVLHNAFISVSEHYITILLMLRNAFISVSEQWQVRYVTVLLMLRKALYNAFVFCDISK